MSLFFYSPAVHWLILLIATSANSLDAGANDILARSKRADAKIRGAPAGLQMQQNPAVAGNAGVDDQAHRPQALRQRYPGPGAPGMPGGASNPKLMSMKSNADQGQGGQNRVLPMKIADHPQCKDVVTRMCSDTVANRPSNFAVLECLQGSKKGSDAVPKECQNFLWQYKRNLTVDPRFDSAAFEICREPLTRIRECSSLPKGTGQVISCLIEVKDNITQPNCRQFLNKMAGIIFADYRLMDRFIPKCQNDIVKLGCGRLHTTGDDSPSSQGRTIECLSEHIGTIDRDCKKQILRVAELQSDDFHLDRPLYFACRDDRERFCERTKAGSGKVYKCLMKHKFERDMSSECLRELTLRQKLTREDYQVDRSFMNACREDVIAYRCKDKTDGMTKSLKMSKVLLCLENNHKKNHPVHPECLAEMDDFRKALMEDYKITPGIVTYCHDEIVQHCGGGIDREGKTLHCLMDLARPERIQGKVLKFSPRIGDTCVRELKVLLEEADIGEDFRIDRMLQEACQPVVDTACKDIAPGDARVLNCLMEKIGTTKMTDDCEERLLEIHYFIARDWQLDTRLYKICHKNAIKFCHAPEDWHDESTSPDQGPLIFSCLYAHSKAMDKDRMLDKQCAVEVKRVMHQRAVNIDLEPRIEEPCLQDLAEFCSEDTDKGQEAECLQDHYDELEQHCRWAIGNYTEDVDEDPQMEKILIQACTPMIKQFCEDVMGQNTEPGDVMECLIKYKHHPSMNRKCAAGIEHHQLITLKDYKFSFKFKEACKKDVMSFCRSMKKKADVVSCLSDHVRNDTLLDEEHRISKVCRTQLKFEFLQRGEDIRLDPRLQEACGADQEKYCKNVTPGRAQIIECLKSHQNDLSPKCQKKLFKRERVEAEDASVDFALISNCRSMIKQYCRNIDPKETLQCLKRHKNDEDFDTKCRKIVLKRLIIHNQDYRLNPGLIKDCKLDIPKFCRQVVSLEKNDEALEGKVIACLKEKFRANKLSRDCEDNIRGVIKEAALDFRQDPILLRACKTEIKDLCLEGGQIDEGDGNKGSVEECLKEKFQQKRIHNHDCQKEVLRLLSEGKADIHVDPVLYTHCSLDLNTICHHVLPGLGRKMSCLMNALEDSRIKLNPTCAKMLRERIEMWEYAAKVAPAENFQELAAQITSSPAKHYFIGVIFAVIGTIFIGGLFCGRVTKRVRREQKNK